MTATNILRIVPVMQSAAVASNAYRDFLGKKGKKQSVKKILKGSTKAIIGISFIAPTANIIGEMK